jgi:hypothetical protein
MLLSGPIGLQACKLPDITLPANMIHKTHVWVRAHTMSHEWASSTRKSSLAHATSAAVCPQGVLDLQLLDLLVWESSATDQQRLQRLKGYMKSNCEKTPYHYHGVYQVRVLCHCQYRTGQCPTIQQCRHCSRRTGCAFLCRCQTTVLDDPRNSSAVHSAQALRRAANSPCFKVAFMLHIGPAQPWCYNTLIRM